VDAEAGRVTFFDFDDCGYGWYMMDIAMLLFDVLVVYDGLDRLRFGEHFLTNLLKGYHAHKPVSLYWIQQLPHFMKLVEIGVYLMLYRSYDPATAGEWVGKFMPSRRERIEQDVPYLELDWGAVHEQVLASS
jgi:Ser/Thr protein kinase RdoA (MazF antagonist)